VPRSGYRAPRGYQAKKKRVPLAVVSIGGRPPGPQKGRVPWEAIQDAALSGASYEMVLAGIDIHADDLADPATQERIRFEVERGNAKYKLQLLRSVRRGVIRKRPSVNTQALAARNILDWDQQLAQTMAPPDLSGVAARLSELIEKLAKKAPRT
jgi:hypothetical protein